MELVYKIFYPEGGSLSKTFTCPIYLYTKLRVITSPAAQHVVVSSRPSFCFKSSLFELARLPDFADLMVIPEDAVRDHGASFAVSEPDCVHVVVDRHLITGQNEASTLTAVQNLVLLCNQR